ncbi:MAG: 2-phospho-L-lactate guanylyltransferase [Verrucomicrobia bacterium]|nr:2-phospho-L-lactate guanylyltransferase [Verrucomicrobiota bacterium]
MDDLIFEVTQEGDGGFVAECLTEPIVTQGDDWSSLKQAISEAVRGFFFDEPARVINIRLHLVKDEVFALA